MSIHPAWSDAYWLLLLQLYLKKPVGVKPLYSRTMINLSLELHIPPPLLYEQMFRLRRLDTPGLKQLWKQYADKPKKLLHKVKLLRQMHGFGCAETFYKGVGVNESFEYDYKPLAVDDTLTPMMLVIILDLYFRLIPITMVVETPEIIRLSKLMHIKPEKIVEIMHVFCACDPYFTQNKLTTHPLLSTCQDIWKRYGNGNPEQLAALASQLKEYFT